MAAATFAPAEIPLSSPSSDANRSAISTASSFEIVTTPSRFSGSRHVRDEPGPDALNLMRTRRPAGENRAIDRLNGDRLEKTVSSA